MAASRSLLALSASALALPGLLARADAPPTVTTIDYLVSNYAEDDLPAAVRGAGSSERYEIDIHQLRLVTPVGSNYAVTLNAGNESMSGASPWYVLRNPSSGPVVTMSGATIWEERSDASAVVRRYLDNGSMALSAGRSVENDYDSISGGLDAERHFDNNQTTIAGSVSFSSDDLQPSDAALFGRVRAASKRSSSLSGSLTRIINADSLFQTSLTYTDVSGYLTDPYKLADARPDSRRQLAWSNAYRRYLHTPGAALHLDYRFYDDDFGIRSHTFGIDWIQNLPGNLQLTPGLRYYSQSEADFFLPANDLSGTLRYQSSDYRLASYGAISGTLRLQVLYDDLRLSLTWERYRSAEKYSLFDEAGSPASVSYGRLSLGVGYEF